MTTPPPPSTDVGNAERLLRAYGDTIRYCPQWGQWLHWNAGRWQPDTLGRAPELAKQTARAALWDAIAHPGEDRKDRIRWAMQSENHQRLKAALDVARTDPRTATDASLLDAHPWLLNTASGIIDLRTGEQRPHDPALLLTKTTGVPYDRRAEGPTFNKFLHRIQPDLDLRGYCQRVLGAALVGQQIEHLAPFFTGGGSNGKSTLLKAVMHALGDHAAMGARDLLVGSQAHPESTAALEGLRLVVIAETREREVLNANQLKAITGGDPVSARHLYGRPYQFEPAHTLVTATNSLPEIRGQDHGTWRRIAVVPFAVTITGAEIDPELSDKLAAEAPAVLAWLVAGCLAWQREGLNPPPAVLEATAAYRGREDHIRRWLDERCFLNPHVSTPGGRLLEDYRAWCRSNGEEPLRGNDWADRLRAEGLTNQRTSSARKWHGIELIPEEAGQ